MTTPTDAPNPVALGAQIAVDVAAALHSHHAEHLLSAVLGAAQPYLHDGDAEQVHEPHVDARLVKHLAQLLRPVPPSAFVAVVDALAPHLIQPGTPAPVVALPDGQRPTGRELQVLVGISRGYGNAEIGAGLYLAEDTVKTVASRLYRRLGAKDRAHAVGLAYELGILPVAAPLAVAS